VPERRIIDAAALEIGAFAAGGLVIRVSAN
jgi:hypothetical protein